MPAFREVFESALREESEPQARSSLPSRQMLQDLARDACGEGRPFPLPSWAVSLGIELPCDAATVRRAFRRLARKTHPDCAGGSHEAFLKAQEVFAEALAAVHTNANGTWQLRSHFGDTKTTTGSSVYA
jgi:hypothetical protein